MIEEHDSSNTVAGYFTSTGQNLVSFTSLIIAIFGIAANIFVLVFFLKIVETRRIQSSLWTNLSLSYLIKCLVIIYGVMGDLKDSMSDTEQECRFRYALPKSIDIVCINNFTMLMLERGCALHCPAFYSIVPKLKSLTLLFGWAYGFSFLLFVVLKIQDYDCPIKCTSPYIHMTPIDPVEFVSFVTAVLFISLCLISMLFLYPANYSKVEKIRLELEISGTYLVIALGTALLVFWTPKQIITGMFWFGQMNLVKYSVTVKLASLLLDMTVVVPFCSLLTIPEFRNSVIYLVTFTSLRPIKRKIMAQESYKNTIRRLVECERHNLVTKTRRQSRLMSFRSSSVSAPTPKVNPVSTPVKVELQGRDEVYYAPSVPVIYTTEV